MKKKYYLIQIFLILCFSCGVKASDLDENIAYRLMEQGKLEEFKKVIIADPQLVFTKKSYSSLLKRAFYLRKYDYIKFLIDRGALDFHYKAGDNPIVWAVYTGDLDIVKYILARSDKIYLNKAPGALPLNTAVAYPNIVEFLLKAGANPEINDDNALDYVMGAMYGCVIDNGLFPISEYKEYKKSGILIFNALKDKKKYMKERKVGFNFFTYGCIANDIEFVDYCLKNQLIDDINAHKEPYGMTVLHYLCYYCSSGAEIVDLLLKYGAKINIKDKEERTPLHYVCASEYGNKEIVKLLLIKKADVNVIDKKGRTALDEAIETSKENRKKEIVQLLRKSGAQTAKELQAVKKNLPKNED